MLHKLELYLLLHHRLLLLQLFADLLVIGSVLLLLNILLMHHNLLLLVLVFRVLGLGFGIGLLVLLVQHLCKPTLFIELVDLLVDVSFETVLIEVVVEVLTDYLLLLHLQLLRHLRLVDCLYLQIRRVVGHDVLLFLGLLVVSFHLLDVSFPGFHVHFTLFLLQLDVFKFLFRVDVLLDEAVTHALHVNVGFNPGGHDLVGWVVVHAFHGVGVVVQCVDGLALLSKDNRLVALHILHVSFVVSNLHHGVTFVILTVHTGLSAHLQLFHPIILGDIIFVFFQSVLSFVLLSFGLLLEVLIIVSLAVTGSWLASFGVLLMLLLLVILLVETLTLSLVVVAVAAVILSLVELILVLHPWRLVPVLVSSRWLFALGPLLRSLFLAILILVIVLIIVVASPLLIIIITLLMLLWILLLLPLPLILLLLGLPLVVLFLRPMMPLHLLGLVCLLIVLVHAELPWSTLLVAFIGAMTVLFAILCKVKIADHGSQLVVDLLVYLLFVRLIISLHAPTG